MRRQHDLYNAKQCLHNLAGRLPFVSNTELRKQGDDVLVHHAGKDYMTKWNAGEAEVFVAQLPFTVTEAYVAALVQMVCKVTVVNVRSRRVYNYKLKCCVPSGSFFVTFATKNDSDMAISSLHKCVLADTDGVWVAVNQAQRLILETYVRTTMRTPVWLPPNMPRCSVVAEPVKSRSVKSTSMKFSEEYMTYMHYANMRI